MEPNKIDKLIGFCGEISAFLIEVKHRFAEFDVPTVSEAVERLLDGLSCPRPSPGPDVSQVNKENFGIKIFNEKEFIKMPKKYKTLFQTGRLSAHVRQKSNGTYEVRCQIDGMRVSASSKNLEQAKKMFIWKLNELESQTNKRKVTFGEYAGEWLDIKEKTVKPSTFDEYLRIVLKDLMPKYKFRIVTEISRREIQEYLFSFVKQGKHKTARKIQLIMKCIFDLACEDLGFNSPMKKIVLPYYESVKGSALTLEEENVLIDFCLKNINKPISSAFLILLYFGLRKSELKTITVLKDSIEVITSKTLLGRNEVKRRIPFTPVFKKLQPVIDFKAKDCNLYTLSNVFKKILPNHHPHELRYTFITRCKECGVNPEIVMLWDGHEEDKSVRSSKIDRGYTDYSWEFQLLQAEKVNYNPREYNDF